MNLTQGLYSSTIGKKILMAVTGIILFGFVVGHMLGNLQLYLGAEQLNAYADKLQSLGPLLWVIRAGLAFCVGVHVVAAVQLWLRNRASRPVRYRLFRPPEVDYAARTMMWSGPIILLFILYHLGHLTVGCLHHDFIRGDVYHNVVTTFRIWWVAGFYMLANLLLAVHLYHGLWSLFQTFGWDHPLFGRARRWIAIGFAVLIGAGNVSLPLAVLAGVVR
ncbi:MAG: succinate dehydrogenase cytochrome b subunit [Thermoanaerobaculales bacterium]|jgi:succinate dehydrogenase / fumarate reductase cytochrome b subunit|nr:succinate dehydrogenase cytochrome b subunit [Thermoanaerobaculales bacterium]